MPLNSSYSPLIQLHNPHSEPIQVLEMYSSGGDLHLELPGGETEGPQTLWQIPPYQTKSVMKANFVARLENNHTAYIRYIKIIKCILINLSIYMFLKHLENDFQRIYNIISE